MKQTSLLLIAFLIAFAVSAQLPQTMSFQGNLTDPNSGDPVADGDYTIDFALWDQAVDGANFWVETQSAVTVINGIFNVKLGSVNPLVAADFAGPLWLEITVGGEILSPRIELSTSAYSQAAKSVIGDNYIPNSGNAHIGGNLNVGGIAPAIDLAIDDDDTGFEVPSDGTLSLYTNGEARMTVRPGGNLGIGTENPPEKLTVAGNILTNGNITAGDTVKADLFHYNTPKEEYLSVPGLAFKINSENNNHSHTIPTSTSLNTNSTSLLYLSGYEGRYLTGGTAGTNAFITAPVYLPQGAIITEISYYVSDTDATDVSYYFYGTGLIDGAYNVSQFVGTSSGTSGNQTLTVSGLNIEIDNTTNVYWCYGNLRSVGTALRLYGALITYTVPGP